MVALAIITANSFAQVQSDIQSATLIHGDQTSVYYGQYAFGSAYSKAEDGDIIVLSAGSFNNANISKSITIYGRGYETDTESGLAPTELSLYIYAKESYDELGNQVYTYPTVTIEGLSGSISVQSDSHGAVLRNLVVRKCKGSIGVYADCENCLISQCVSPSFHVPTSSYKASALNIENSWLSYVRGNEDIKSTINFDHCIIYKFNYHYYGNTGDAPIANYTNCIFLDTGLPTYSTTANNIFVSSTGSTETIDANGNWRGVSNTLVWAEANENGDYAATKTFALKFPAKYVGTDGTEVGINGGHAPFDRISPIPRILAADVDLRTAEDGKLNVNFKVEAQTKE